MVPLYRVITVTTRSDLSFGAALPVVRVAKATFLRPVSFEATYPLHRFLRDPWYTYGQPSESKGRP